MSKDVSSIQQDEISVLESIFTEDFHRLNSTSEFEIVVRFDNCSTRKILLIDDKTDRRSEVSNFPPLIVRIDFVENYPEKRAPFYTVVCDFLSPRKLIRICDELDKIWFENEPVVFNWIESIKSSIEKLFDEFHLDDSTPEEITDRRFSTNFHRIGSSKIYQQLIDYDRVETLISFERNLQDCPICLENKIGRQCVLFEKCRHSSCLDCLNKFARECLLNGNRINCFECQSDLSLNEIRRILNDDRSVIKYQERLLEKTVDMVWCPRCQQSIVVTPSESQSGNHPSFVECFNCQFMYCRRCQETWHPQILCPKDERIGKILTDNKQTVNNELTKEEMKRLLNEIETMITIKNCSKACPSCHVRIEKNGGCNHMHCRSCSVHFCWTCGWSANSYSFHSCLPKEFDQPIYVSESVVEVLDSAMKDPNQRRAKKQIKHLVQRCPKESCGRTHIKTTKINLMNCQFCHTNFCFVCGEQVFGNFHFNEYTCPYQ